MPACFAMSARYWKRLRPDLPLPTEQQTWDDFILLTSARTSRGTSLLRLLRNVPTADQTPSSDLLDQGLESLQEEAEQEGTEIEPVRLSNLVLPKNSPELPSK